MAQMGPYEIIEAVEGFPARGGLFRSVPVIEPALAAATAVERATAALLEAENALDAREGTANFEEQQRASDAVSAARETLAKAIDAQTGSRRWENGITYRPFGGCAPANTWTPCHDPSTVKNVDPTAPLVSAVPITLYAGFTCSTWALDEMERIAHAEIRLQARGGQAMETELWKGTNAIAEGWPNPRLAGPATVQLSGAGQSSPAPYALGALQDALRDCNGSDFGGIIHATPSTVNIWKDHHFIEIEKRTINGEEREVLVDVFGNIVIGGGGYDGSSPTGTIDPTGRVLWAYATGPVKVLAGSIYITPDETKQAVQRDVNDVTWRAERSAVAMFDPCCVFGIAVDLCDTACDPQGPIGS